MTDRFEKGYDEMKDGADYMTWGINDLEAPQAMDDERTWANRIEIHSTDARLRNTILGLLNGVVEKKE